MVDPVQVILDAKATNVDEFAKKTLDMKGRLDDLAASALNLTGRWGRLWLVANLIPGVGSALSGAFKAAAIAGGALVASMAAIAVMTTRSAQRITTLSGATNALRKDLQALSFVADATTAPLESLHNVFLGLAQVQGEMQAGIGKSAERVKALESLGITLEDIRRKDPKQIFAELTQRLADGVVPTERMAAGVKLFGESFRDVVAASKQDLPGLMKEWQELSESVMSNVEISETALTTLSKMGDAWDQMWAKAKAGAKHFSAELTATVANAAKLAFWSTAGVIPGAIFPKYREKRDEHLLDAYQYFVMGDSGEASGEQADRRRQDLDGQKKREDEVGSLKSQIRELSGDEFDIDMEEMDERGARTEEYSRLLRRIQKRKPPKAQKEETATGSMFSNSDALSRIGLFRGGAGSVQTILVKQERKLTQIHNELKTQTAIARKQDE